jgi:hypothetical protein
MENDNILDNDVSNIGDDDTSDMMHHLTTDIFNLVDNISSGGVDPVRYPIGNAMYKDLKHHTKPYPIVCIHLCVYQRQTDMRKRPFVQYLLRLENDELGFYNKPFFNSADSDLYIEATSMLRILMMHYGKFLMDDDMFEYMGFHPDGNDFYVFFDVTKTWVAYHLLGMTDPFWTVMTHEIIGNETVCGYPVSQNTRSLFNTYPELVHLIDRDNNPYALPRTGYSLENAKDVDRVLLFGMHSTPLPALGGNYFQFMDSYADCVRGRTTDELKGKIVTRYCLMCDDPTDPAPDMVYEGDLEGHEGTSYHATDASGRHILAVKDFYAQTTITAYNAISDVVEPGESVEVIEAVEADVVEPAEPSELIEGTEAVGCA